MHQKVSLTKQVETGQFLNLAQNQLNSRNYFSILFCDFPLIA